MNSIVSISDVRQDLPEFVDKVNKTHEKVVITVNGKAKAALVSAELLESLEETAELLTIPDLLRDLRKSQKQVANGKFVSLADL